MVHKKGHISENTVWYLYVPVRCHQYHTAVPYVALPYRYTIYQYRSYGTGDTMRSSDRALRHYRQRTDVTSGIRYSPPDRAIARAARAWVRGAHVSHATRARSRVMCARPLASERIGRVSGLMSEQ